MTTRMAATARTIPKTYASLAGSGLSAMCPLLAPEDVVTPNFRGANRERCVSYCTLRIIIILMEAIKDLYQTPTAIHPSLFRGFGVCTGPDFRKRKIKVQQKDFPMFLSLYPLVTQRAELS